MGYKSLIAQKIKRLFTNKVFLILLLLLLVVGLTSFSLTLNRFNNQEKANKQTEQKQAQLKPQNSTESTVLGSNTQVPQIYISGGDQGYSTGGMIALASTDEPAVVIGGYNISGDAEITMYEASENALLDYLTHDKDGKQTKKNPDVSQFHYITTVKHNINTSSYQGSKIPLPFGEIGIWYLKVKIGSTNADAFVLRSNIGEPAEER